ncbi:MAG TPA: glycosyltransferase family 2 protein [Verrucomicrobiae bacterium]
MPLSRFHALLPVRDEADIIGQFLQHLLGWADAVYVFDTGSVDNTWEIVQDFAARDGRVVPLRKDAVFFSDTKIRGWIFHQARKHMREGDWFLRVDADEFHHIPPPDFVRTRLRKYETIVWHQYYDFRLTASEVRAWEAGRESLADRHRPIEQRRQWFTPSDYSEPRLCRYRETMQWPATHSFPVNAGYVARQRLPIRHYPHRDPEQLRRRVRLRSIMMANYNRGWTSPQTHHWSEDEWRKFIAPDNLPGLCHWKSGGELAEVQFKSHLRPPHIRAVQRFVHAFCLPHLDRLRAKWTESAYPPKIPAEIANYLQQELRENSLI